MVRVCVCRNIYLNRLSYLFPSYLYWTPLKCEPASGSEKLWNIFSIQCLDNLSHKKYRHTLTDIVSRPGKSRLDVETLFWGFHCYLNLSLSIIYTVTNEWNIYVQYKHTWILYLTNFIWIKVLNIQHFLVLKNFFSHFLLQVVISKPAFVREQSLNNLGGFLSLNIFTFYCL